MEINYGHDSTEGVDSLNPYQDVSIIYYENFYYINPFKEYSKLLEISKNLTFQT